MLGVLLTALAPRALSAQRLTQLPAIWLSHSPLDSNRERPPLIGSGDYRLEGAVAGGVLVGAAGVLIGSLACADPSTDGTPRSCAGTELAGGVVGVAVGVVLGYLVGRSVPKATH